MTSAAWLTTDHLRVHYGNRTALRDVCIQLRPGETVSLVGPNGAGKSTLLKALAGMLTPSHGYVRFRGRTIGRAPDEIVYVPQRAGVDWTFPVSVLDVVLMGLPRQPLWRRVLPYRQDQRAAALMALERAGMASAAKFQIGQLSGGQQQRVFLARALLQEGDVYLLDEPFSGVDIPTQELLVNLFDGLRRQGKTIVYATHDLQQAARASDRLVLINEQVIADGSAANALTVANLRATFGGQAVILDARGALAGSDLRSEHPQDDELSPLSSNRNTELLPVVSHHAQELSA